MDGALPIPTLPNPHAPGRKAGFVRYKGMARRRPTTLAASAPIA
jgi:hypothetical protein